MRKISSIMVLAACAGGLFAAPLTVGGVPGVNPAQFRITTFASNLGAATSLSNSPGGGLLVASGFVNASVRRFVDSNGDGLADAAGATVIQVNGTGAITSMVQVGNLIAVGVAGQGIQFFAPGAGPDSPYTLTGSIQIGYSPNWGHNTPGLAVRPSAGAPGSFDVLFSIGAAGNNTVSPSLTLSGLIGATVNADSIQMVRITPTAGTVSASNLVQVVTGIRNATAMSFRPGSGDYFFADNGIDGFPDPNEPASADELNLITAGDLGTTIVDFGYSSGYITYRTGSVVGGGTQPLHAFQPLGNPLTGSEAEGAAGIAFSPAGYPGAVGNGIFVSFAGRGAATTGIANEENPIRYYDFGTGLSYDFVSNNEAGVVTPTGMMGTNDSIFFADLQAEGGSVVQIKYIADVPEPSTISLVGSALGLLAWRRKSARSSKAA